ncbi:MAG: hypothetical protein HC880_20480 [Bacteroidia bacterium]|nr:hypothetical protein [Bacteroidia bacterium]
MISQNQFLFGPSLMVCPVPSDQRIARLYLPEGQWYDLLDDTFYPEAGEIYMETPLDKIPLLVKAGTMLLMQTCVNHSDEKPRECLELHLYQGKPGAAFNIMRTMAKAGPTKPVRSTAGGLAMTPVTKACC